MHLFCEDLAEVGSGRVVRRSFVRDLDWRQHIHLVHSRSVQEIDCSGYDCPQRPLPFISFGRSFARITEPQLARRRGAAAAIGISVSRAPAIGLTRLKRTSTSFVVSCMRVFGLWSLRVAVEASLVSK